MLIFENKTYRCILRQELARRVEQNQNYSANSFAKKVGVSQSYLSLVLSGKRSLTEKIAQKITTNLNFNEIEKNYFLLLVRKESAPTDDICKFYDSKIGQLKKEIGSNHLDIEKFHVISDWYYSAILECINLDNLKHSAKSFATYLDIDESIVVMALKKLIKLNVIKKDNRKYIRNDSGFLATSAEIQSKALRKFHKQIFKKAAQAIEQQTIEERFVSGITLAMDPDKLPEAKKRIQDFMEDLMKFLEDGKKTEVYQLSTQLFKLKEYKEINE